VIQLEKRLAVLKLRLRLPFRSSANADSLHSSKRHGVPKSHVGSGVSDRKGVNGTDDMTAYSSISAHRLRRLAPFPHRLVADTASQAFLATQLPWPQRSLRAPRDSTFFKLNGYTPPCAWSM